jgi:RND family efflux transporter MFP subunit
MVVPGNGTEGKFMIKHAWVRHTAAAVILASTAVLAAPSARAADSIITYPGYTQPSEQRKLNFNGPGVVVKVHVKEGDFVKKGTLLAEQDDRVEQEHLKGAMIEANSKLQIDAAEATLAEKKVEYDKKKQMLDKKVIGALDVLEAELDVKISEARLKLASEDRQQKQAEVDETKAKIAQKKLYATTDGIVQQIGVHEGELASNDPKMSAVSMVTNEPLYVEVNLPITVTKDMQKGQKLQVRYEDEEKWQTAEVIYFNPVANPMARLQMVRLALENPNHYRAGLTVLVKLPEKLAAAQEAR